MDKEPFQLRERVAELAEYLFPQLDKFPRTEKWAAATRIKQTVYEVQRYAIRVQRQPPGKKGPEIRELDLELEFLRDLLRHAHSRQWLKMKAHKVSFNKVAEIGKMVGALRKRYGDEGAQP